MSFSDFTFPQVQEQLGLSVIEADLFSHVPVDEIRPALREQLELGGAIALSINTEKARSEFLIAPVLLELRRWAGERLGLFSGVPLDGDAAKGLSGICDFLLTISGRQLVVSSPIITVVEAKNDNLLSGLGQCIASMVAARMVNERENQPGRVVFGAVTTGSAWKFLRLEHANLTIDRREYVIDNAGKIVGIFKEIVQSASPNPNA